MKKFWKQTAVIACALVLTICLIVGLSVNTLAASTSGQQVGTNHCVEHESYSINNSGMTNPDGSPYTDPANNLTNPDGTPYTDPANILTNPDGSPYEDTEPVTDEVYPGTLELYCDLVIWQTSLNEPIAEYGMNQNVPGFSINFYRTVSDLEPSNKLYYATVLIGSCIYPADPRTEGETVSFLVLKKGDINFRCHSTSGSLTVTGDGIDTNITQPSIPEETVTYPFTTVPFSQDITYPSEYPIWTSSPLPDLTTTPVFGTTEPVTTIPTTQMLVQCGDVNLDGVISIDDATCVQLHAAEKMRIKNTVAADVNGDGEINIIDATYIQRYLADFIEDIGFTGEGLGYI